MQFIWRMLFKALGFWLLLLGSVAAHAVTADRVFAEFSDAVYQIKIIEIKSGSQSGLGTGFVVSHPDHGKLIATNYHVISGKVLESDKYRIEVEVGTTLHKFDVVAVDVVNDLALLHSDKFELQAEPFQLAQQASSNGALLFSLGNPHDLGLTIVQGNYNGLVENKFLERIHFSGAVNPGMSGGPVVSESKEVVGINVATSGNQIGFLVPVKFLDALLNGLPNSLNKIDLFETMAEQIADATTTMVAEITEAEWTSEPMEKGLVLAKTVDWMECWGDSKKNKEARTLEVSRGCNNSDRIFISSRFFSGFFEYEFYYVSAEDWPVSAFYRALSRNTGGARPGNSAGKRDVGNFSCVGDVIDGLSMTQDDAEPMRRKISYCVRAYQRLPGLYDAFYVGVSNDKDNKALMEHFTLSGVTQEAAQAFLRKFMEVVAWQ